MVLEPKLGAVFAGIGLATLLPALAEIQKLDSGAAIALPAFLGIIGTFLGMAESWHGPSWWPDSVWAFVGTVFASASLWAVFHISNHWWQAALVALALAQIAAVAAPILVSLQRYRACAPWRQLEEVVLSAAPDVVLEQTCPNCGSGLRITYFPGVSLVIWCISCHSSTTRYGDFEQPAWVNALGPRVVTDQPRRDRACA